MFMLRAFRIFILNLKLSQGISCRILFSSISGRLARSDRGVGTSGRCLGRRGKFTPLPFSHLCVHVRTSLVSYY